ncbi:hypothetical protein EC973_001527 [Apophysomyces ossiformis]|uniref:F-box domain-containing protein n=1 Tax=Apophysomyces ossiformis TaxID=679940 RepID=A0A8H7BNV8_9FUNG|nr:hypothetical protein EC973_001527 [Apophysomyces ossiformis]
MRIEAFPPEVLADIDVYFSIYDRLVCLVVCKTWYTVFRPLFYRTVIVDTDLELLCHALQASAKTASPIGPLIKHLVLYEFTSDYHTTGFEDLAVLCPNLQSLTYHWKSISEDLGIKYILRSVPIPNYLTHLTIHTSTAIKDLIPSLPFANRLKSFRLNTTGDLHFEHLRNLHLSCPELHSLSIGTVELCIDASASALPIHDMQHAGSKLRTLKLCYYRPWKRPISWLAYIAKTYPNLQTLQVHEPFNEWFTITGRECSEMVEKLEFLYPHIKNVEAADVQFCERFLESLFPSDPQAAVTDMTFGYSSAFNEILVKHFSKTRLEQLSVLTILSATSSAWLTLRDIMPCLKMLRLRELTIGPEQFVMDPNASTLYIDTLLDSCPYLKKLTVFRCSISSEGSTQQPHGLQSLILNHIYFGDHPFDYLAKQCHKLRHLSILNSCDVTWEVSDRTQDTCIYLPHHELDTLHLESIVVQYPRVSEMANAAPTRFPATMYRIVQGDCTRWVFMGDSPTSDVEICDTRHASVVRRMDISPHLVDQEGSKVIERLTNSGMVRLFTLMVSDSKAWEKQLRNGYITLACKSVNRLYINKRRVCLPDTKRGAMTTCSTRQDNMHKQAQ